MHKRRKDPLEQAVPAVGAFFFLGVFFVPGIERIIPWGTGLLTLGALAWVAIQLSGRRKFRISTSGSNGCTVPCASSTDGCSCETGQQFEPGRTPRETLRHIEWSRFEQLVAAIYEAKNYTVTRRGGENPDGGVDLIVENPATRFVVHCQQWKNWKTGARHIREFLRTLTDSGIRKGVFITLRGYSEEARDLAAKHGIDLLDEYEIVSLLEKVRWKYNPSILTALKSSTKPASKFESKLNLRTARRGKLAGSKVWSCVSYARSDFILTE